MMITSKQTLFNPTAMSFVCPGVGQAFQKRYVAAAFFFCSWTACALVMMGSAGKIIIEYYSLINFNAVIDEHLPVIPLVVSFAGVILLWLMGILDTVLASHRAARRRMPPPFPADYSGAALNRQGPAAPPKNKLGLVIVLSGPSGSGKTTVYRQVLDRRKDVEFSVSCTTRSPRPGETHGRDYHFISREDFLTRRDQGLFLESAEVHANYYGTLREEVERRVAAGVSVLLDVDVQGARSIRQAVAGTPLAAHTIFIFTAPPSVDLLEFRLRKRGTDSEAVIQTRLTNAREELTAWREYDYFLVNDGVDAAVRDLTTIIDGALQKTTQWKSTPWEKTGGDE